MVTTEPVRIPLPRWLVGVFGCVAVFLVPWILYLTFTLPSRHVTVHYDLAWVGFDVALTVAFVATAWAVLRGSRWLVALAAVTGTMLCLRRVVRRHDLAARQTSSSRRSGRRLWPSCRSPPSAPTSSTTRSSSSPRRSPASAAQGYRAAALRADLLEEVGQRAALEDESEVPRRLLEAMLLMTASPPLCRARGCCR